MFRELVITHSEHALRAESDLGVVTVAHIQEPFAACCICGKVRSPNTVKVHEGSHDSAWVADYMDETGLRKEQ